MLILDDLGIKPLADKHYQDLYDVVDKRGEDKSIIVTTQVPVENWREIIDDPISCEAISDRLSSTATTVTMNGASYRARRQKRARLDKV